jgi:hypothetical protein
MVETPWAKFGGLRWKIRQGGDVVSFQIIKYKFMEE